MYDYDHGDVHHINLGMCEIQMNKLLTAPKQIFKDFLKDEDDKVLKGKIIIRADTVAKCNFEMRCQINAFLVPKRRTKWTFAICLVGLWADLSSTSRV